MVTSLRRWLGPRDGPAVPVEPLVRRKAAELSIWMSQAGQRAIRERAHLRERSEAQIYWNYGYLAALGDVIEVMHGRRSSLDTAPALERQTGKPARATASREIV